MRTKLFITLGGSLFPLLAFAQNDATELVGTISTIVSSLVPIVSLIVVIVFFWGLAKYLLSAGDAEAAREGKSIMIYGVIAIFVMISIYGIVGFIQRTTGTDQAGVSNTITLPDVSATRAR